MYHLLLAHPLKYLDVADIDRQKISETRSVTNFLSCQRNKPANDNVSADLKVTLAYWIASSGHPILNVEDDGLQTATDSFSKPCLQFARSIHIRH